MLELHKQAEEMIRARGERATSARVHVLATLLAEQRAVAHHEIEEACAPQTEIGPCYALSGARMVTGEMPRSQGRERRSDLVIPRESGCASTSSCAF